jgi:hypothetical protein
MDITTARGPRQIACRASLACLAVLLTACNSSTSSAAAGTTGTASTSAPVTGPTTPPSTSAPVTGPAAPPSTSGPVTGPTTPPGAPASAPGVTGADTFLAPEQSLNATLLHEPACGGFGCALSGDSTAFLASMKWTTWSGTEAVGTGTYKLDDCNPDCASGHVYSVAAVVTLSQPVKVCSAASTRWVWSHASFTFPHGLPKALQGDNAPQNPWTFSGLITAARQTCTS